MKRSNKKGIAIMECIVAFLVIAVVGMASLTVAGGSLYYSGKISEYLEARRIAENSLECFKYANDADEFLEAIRILQETSREFPVITNDYDVFRYEGKNYYLDILIDYEDDSDRALFSAVATNRIGSVIFEVTYEKG